MQGTSRMPPCKIAIIDYHTGNSQSVSYALDVLKAEHTIARSPREAAAATHIILPGVGSAGTTMSYLREDGWLPFIQERVITQRTPFLGICIGMQVLFEHSEEQDAACLGWLPGAAHAFDRSSVRVPHMGWNQVAITSSHPFIAGFPSNQYFYFVNSYYVAPDDADHGVGATTYDGSFTSIVAKENIMATQFHIEKSGPIGLSLLNRFANLSKDALT